MLKLPVYNLKGEKVADKDLSTEIFNVELNPIVLTQSINQKLANRRAVTSHTKTRGEVSGGGRKPFKQKGTGNARAGSNRSPLWIGGGITFGPRKNRNYKKRIPKKVQTAALKMVLSEKVKDQKIIVLENFKMNKISTKQVYDTFSKLPIEEGKILVILPKMEVNTELSLANIPYAKVIKADNLSVLDLSKYNYLVTTVEGLDKIKEILTTKPRLKEKVLK